MGGAPISINVDKSNKFIIHIISTDSCKRSIRHNLKIFVCFNNVVLARCLALVNVFEWFVCSCNGAIGLLPRIWKRKSLRYVLSIKRFSLPFGELVHLRAVTKMLWEKLYIYNIDHSTLDFSKSLCSFHFVIYLKLKRTDYRLESGMTSLFSQEQNPYSSSLDKRPELKNVDFSKLIVR